MNNNGLKHSCPSNWAGAEFEELVRKMFDAPKDIQNKARAAISG